MFHCAHGHFLILTLGIFSPACFYCEHCYFCQLCFFWNRIAFSRVLTNCHGQIINFSYEAALALSDLWHNPVCRLSRWPRATGLYLLSSPGLTKYMSNNVRIPIYSQLCLKWKLGNLPLTVINSKKQNHCHKITIWRTLSTVFTCMFVLLRLLTVICLFVYHSPFTSRQ